MNIQIPILKKSQKVWINMKKDKNELKLYINEK